MSPLKIHADTGEKTEPAHAGCHTEPHNFFTNL